MRMPQEEEQEESKTDAKQELSGIVPDVSEFAPVENPGPLSLENLGPDKELFIVRMPQGMVPPPKLANMNLTLDVKKKRSIQIDNHLLSVSAYESSTVGSTPSIFLPNDDGELHQVKLNIAGQIILKHEPLSSSDKTTIDINNLRAVQHQPPSDIQERNFLKRSKTEKRTLVQATEEETLEVNSKKKKKKKKKKKQEEAVIEENMEEEEEEVSIKPSKKKKHKRQSLLQEEA
ncbi:uncharacterized protein LOC125039638 [Penaeus chinensis]|uniref:uncharacterized protein LOC125039638 n=1 Tax=Penaeus chinensis TaxID=139456 RepID=UPI001FB620AC|nr:uncharacterized protein LOC125039638 [Penaeus chinensis]